MAGLNKRTPCVGICSTTYGDLVCRGCKRFAHEIVQWNSYDEQQQLMIWERLHRLRSEVLDYCLYVTDAEQFEQACVDAGISQLPEAELHYELLRFLVSGSRALGSAGLALRNGTIDLPGKESLNSDDTDAPAHDPQQALRVIQWVDAEIYQRSLAHYERNFKIQP